MNHFRGISCLVVALSKLAIDIKAPCKHDTLVGQSGNVAETSCTLHEVFALLRLHLDFLRQLDKPLILGAELPETSLTPTPDIAFFSDGQAEERTTCNIVNRLSIERFYVLRSTSDLDTFADSKLSFKASAPSIDISLISKYKRVMLSACNLNDSLVPEWLEDSGSEFTASTTMANSALDTRPVREYISITSQVQGVVPSALDEHQVTHIVMLLLSP